MVCRLSFALLFVLVLSFASAGLYEGVLGEDSTNIEYTNYGDFLEIVYSFESPILLENGDYWEIDISGLTKSYEEGVPILPIYLSSVLIPKGFSIKSIDYSFGEKTFLLEGVPAMGQKDIPLSEVGNVLVEEIKDSYSEKNNLFNYTSSQFRGYNLANLIISPIEYNKKEGEIYFIEEFKVIIELTDSSDRNEFFRNLRSDEIEVKKMVVNPEESYGYHPVGRFSTMSLPSVDNYPYIIITSDYLNSLMEEYSFSTLLNWKMTRSAFPINGTIVVVEDIYNDSRFWCNGAYGDGKDDSSLCSYSGFNDSAAMIRNFIKYAYAELGTQYVLLGGNITTIPTRSFYNPLTYRNETHYILTDMYFSNLNGSFNDNMNELWADDDDIKDFDSEVYVGRAPVNNYGELNNFVRKTILYENISINEEEDYLKNTFFNYDSGVSYLNGISGFFQRFNIIKKPWAVWGNMSMVNYIYEKQGTIEIPHIINIAGHGAVYGAGGFKYHSTNPTISNADNFSNYNQPFLINSQGCWTGKFDYESSFSRRAVVTQNNSVLVISNTDYGWKGTGDIFMNKFWQEMYESDKESRSVGRVLSKSKYDSLNVYFSSTSKWTYWSLNLLGDPETRVFFSPEYLPIREILIYSPLNEHYYNTPVILLNVSSTETISEAYPILYSNNSGYFDYSEVVLNFSEGRNILSFYQNYTGGALEKNVTFSVDTISPRVVDSTNKTRVNRFDNLVFVLNISDEQGVQNIFLESNFSGDMTNYSFIRNLSYLGEYNSIETFLLENLTSVSNFSYRFHAIDLAGNYNFTEFVSVNVINSLPILNESYERISFPINLNFSLNKSLLFSDVDGDNISIVGIYSDDIIVNESDELIVFSCNSLNLIKEDVIFSVNDTQEVVNYTISVLVYGHNWHNSTRSFNGNTTNLSLLENVYNIPLVLENSSYGKINFFSINLTNPEIDFSNLVEISRSKIFVNSSAISELNIPARIYFYGVNVVSTSLDFLVLYKDDSVCLSCSGVEYNSTTGNYAVNVSGFSTYEIKLWNKDINCFDGVKNGFEVGVDCGGLCVACPVASASSGGGGSGGGGGYINNLNNSVVLNYTKDGVLINVSEEENINVSNAERNFWNTFAFVLFIVALIFLAKKKIL